MHLIRQDKVSEIKKGSGKHRYYYFLGDKRHKREMKKMLLERYKILPYPKGENSRYDASYKPQNQMRLMGWD